MKNKPSSTQFVFVLDNQKTLQNIDHLKMNDYEKFCKTNQLGTQITALAKANQWEEIAQQLDKYHTLIPFLKLEIEDAFVCALNLRNYETVKYFLENGFDLCSVAEDAPLTVCYALEYLHNEDAPLELLKLILSFGGNARCANDRDSQTPMHIAAQAGHIAFMKVLLEYGADLNAINDDRETPLGAAIRCKRQGAIEFLKGLKANEKWNS